MKITFDDERKIYMFWSVLISKKGKKDDISG